MNTAPSVMSPKLEVGNRFTTRANTSMVRQPDSQWRRTPSKSPERTESRSPSGFVRAVDTSARSVAPDPLRRKRRRPRACGHPCASHRSMSATECNALRPELAKGAAIPREYRSFPGLDRQGGGGLHRRQRYLRHHTAHAGQRGQVPHLETLVVVQACRGHLQPVFIGACRQMAFEDLGYTGNGFRKPLDARLVLVDRVAQIGFICQPS